jgi:hypothetical protein
MSINLTKCAALALLLGLAQGGVARAQYYAAQGYNPYTGNYYRGVQGTNAAGGVVAGAAAYNPYTGAHGSAGASYNPYSGATRTAAQGTTSTGTQAASRSYTNPYTGTTAHVQAAYNPYTGRGAVHASAYRR